MVLYTAQSLPWVTAYTVAHMTQLQSIAQIGIATLILYLAMIYVLLDYRKISPHKNQKYNRRLFLSRKFRRKGMNLKKLVVFSVVFALVAVVAFADINVGANVGSGVVIAKSSGEKDADVETGVGRHTARITADGENDDGTFGGQVYVFAETHDADFGNHWWWGSDAFAFAWWKPIQYVRLQFGHNPYGDIDCKQIVDWGFHASDAPDVGMHNPYGTGDNSLGAATGFYGGFSNFGSLLSLYPVDGLTVNFAVPFSDGKAEDVYKYFHAQIKYDLNNIGSAAISYTGGKNELAYTGSQTAPFDLSKLEVDHSKLFASFYLTAINNMEVNFGFAFPLPVKDDDLKMTYQDPLEVGLGFSFNANDALNIKARLATTFAGNIKPDNGDALNKPFQLGFNIMPSYDLNIVKAFFKAGIMFTGESEAYNAQGKPEKVKDSSAFGWHINPYLTKSVGPGTFYAGFVLESDGIKGSSNDGDKSAVQWSIPLAIVFGF